jgi:dynein heavy chain
MIVPTVDTIRYEYLIYHLLLNKHEVLLVGSVGTGKTTVAENVLAKLDSNIYNLLLVHMSAQVNPNIFRLLRSFQIE